MTKKNWAHKKHILFFYIRKQLKLFKCYIHALKGIFASPCLKAGLVLGGLGVLVIASCKAAVSRVHFLFVFLWALWFCLWLLLRFCGAAGLAGFCGRAAALCWFVRGVSRLLFSASVQEGRPAFEALFSLTRRLFHLQKSQKRSEFEFVSAFFIH